MTHRLIAIVVAAALIAFLVIFGPSMCNSYFAEKKARQVEGGQADAALDSIEEANRTAADIDRQEGEIAAKTGDLADSVRAGEPGNSGVEAEAALCRMKAYRDTPKCKREANAP
jgi:hypothetical protein